MTTDFKDIEGIKAENIARHKRVRVQYNPLTGVGCAGKRVRRKVAWEAKQVLLPEAMVKDAEWSKIKNEKEYKRLRIKYDFEYWAATCCKIRHKISGERKPFVLNAPQRRVLAVLEADRLAGRPVRVILLKARQWGGSTLVQMYFAWIQCAVKRSWHSLICAHVKNTSAGIRGMYRAMLASYPRELWSEERAPGFRPYEGLSGTREIVGRDCCVTISSALSQDATRGLDVQMAHLSEVAYWKDSNQFSPGDFVRAVCGGIALSPLTMVVMESTANGMGNYFHDEWLRAEASESSFRPVFVPWHEIEMYAMKVEDVAGLVKSMDDYERGLWKQGLTLEQIAWYHYRRKDWKLHRHMKAEYPTTAAEAFANTGSGVFPAEDVERMRRHVSTPERGWLTAQSPTGPGTLKDISFTADDDGDMEVWRKPCVGESKRNRYVVAVDVGGRSAGADYSVISVLDRFDACGKPAIVMQWRGHCDHDLLGWRAAMVSRWYHNALLVVESNTLESGADGASRFILETISRYYHNIYCRTATDTRSPHMEHKFGFHTNVATKGAAIVSLICAVRDGKYEERSHEACCEFLSYEQFQNGSYGARRGHHDDVLMTRAMLIYVASKL